MIYYLYLLKIDTQRQKKTAFHHVFMLKTLTKICHKFVSPAKSRIRTKNPSIGGFRVDETRFFEGNSPDMAWRQMPIDPSSLSSFVIQKWTLASSNCCSFL